MTFLQVGADVAADWHKLAKRLNWGHPGDLFVMLLREYIRFLEHHMSGDA